MSASYTGGSGTPLLLLHGFTDTWRAWTRLLPALEAQHRVLAPTLPGHAGGDAVTGEVSMNVLVDAVETMMDTADMPTAHIAGNSLGGWLGLELAVRGRARSVIALCPGGGWEDGTREAKRVTAYFKRTGLLLGFAAGRADFLASRPRLRKVALGDLVSHPERIRPADAAHMIRSAADCAIRDAMIEHTTRDHFSDLGPIDVPVCIAWGTDDRLLPPKRYSARLRRLVPHAEWVDLPGLGHLPMWDDPVLVSRTILDVTRSVDG